VLGQILTLFIVELCRFVVIIQLERRLVQNHFISFSQHILHFAKPKAFPVALSISSIFPASFIVDVFRLFLANPSELFYENQFSLVAFSLLP